MAKLIQVPVALIQEQLAQFNRDPFRDSLARILQTEPNPAAMRAFARKAPDRWGQLVSMFARLSGFSDRVEIDHNIAITVHSMSDADLLSRLQAIENKLNMPQLIDITPQSK